jgi:serine protease Do
MIGPRPPAHRVIGVALAIAAGLAWGVFAGARAETPHKAAPPASFASVVNDVRASVVSIRLPFPGLSPAESLDDDGFDEHPEDTLLRELADRLRRAHGGVIIGAGVVVDGAGTTLTSARVVMEDGDVEVVTFDGTVVKAKVVGIDDQTDLALLRLDPARRPYAHVQLGDSDKVVVGEWVIAIGAPYGLQGTVTAGIISATVRPSGAGPYAELLQTDSPMSIGNAGGPLFNTKGEVIGIASALGEGHGVGLAVPSNTARKVGAELSEWGRVRRGWLGVTVQPVTAELARGFHRSDTRGVLVADVEPDSPAAAAGLKPGDILLDFDARPLASRVDFDRALAASLPGQTARLGVWRTGRAATAQVVLADEPGPPSLTPGLGLAVRALKPGLGVVVIEVEPGSPAARAGVRRGDLILEVDQQRILNPKDFARLTGRPRKGSPLVLLLQRGASALFIALTSSR